MEKNKNTGPEIIEVIAHPGSSKRCIVKKNGVYHAYTPKKAINGEANKDIILLISDNLNSPKSSIKIFKGEKSKVKLFKILK